MPKNIQEILNNDSFTTEVEKYGADPATNPFLQFLLNLKNNYKQIWNKINYGQYGVIHNAVIGEQVTLRELQTGKDVKLGDRSMLLFEAFYSVSTTDEHKYLDLRKKLWEKINITLNPVSPGAKIHAVQIPEVGAKLTAQLAHDILVNGDTLRSLKDANDIINQLFSDYERLKKPLATDAVSIQRDIAKELGCSVEDLPDHKDEIILAMKVLLNRAYLNIPLKLDSIYKLAKSLGIDQKEVFTGIEKDENAKWRNYFESDNIDSSNIVQKIVTAVAPIINKEAKNADNAK